MSKSNSDHKFNDITVGVAASPTTIDVFIFELETRWQERNTQEGAMQLLNALSCYELSRILIEVKGAQAHHFLKACTRKELPIVLAHPKQVIEYIKQLEPLSNEEQLDARLIAYYGAKTKPKPHPGFSQKVNRIEQLLQQKQQLHEMYLQEIALQSTIPTAVAGLHSTFIKQLETGMASIELALAQEAAESREGQYIYEILSAAP